ncbi:MAG: hypothetical protein ACI80H_001689, partial [Pseudoalteromonas distincta]
KAKKQIVNSSTYHPRNGIEYIIFDVIKLDIKISIKKKSPSFSRKGF